MRKVLLVSALALAVTGCASTQEQAPGVEVRDLSASRDQSAASTYTVVSGDTLYGIAWRHNMDYRDLAKRNDIQPPYRIQPGQKLALKAGGGNGKAARATDTTDSATRATAVATPLGVDDATNDDTSWLQPNEAAIERSRRLEAGPVARSDSTSAVSANEPGTATNVATVGPVYSYDSPGADGSLSERDRAERRALESQWVDSPEAAETSDETVPTAAVSDEQPVEESEATKPAPEPVSPPPRKSPESAPSTDAGTSVAGEPEAEKRTSRRYTPVKEIAWQWPVEGNLIGDFGEGEGITAGIDIAGQKGQSVKAAGPGIVVYAGNGVRGYGNLVLLKHNDQFLSAYAHNDSLKVQENDVVEAGEVIATMGDSDAETIRLHFEVRKDGQPQNPLDFLPPR